MFRAGDRVRIVERLGGSSTPRGTIIGFVNADDVVVGFAGKDDVVVRWDVGIEAGVSPASLMWADCAEADAA